MFQVVVDKAQGCDVCRELNFFDVLLCTFPGFLYTIFFDTLFDTLGVFLDLYAAWLDALSEFSCVGAGCLQRPCPTILSRKEVEPA